MSFPVSGASFWRAEQIRIATGPRFRRSGWVLRCLQADGVMVCGTHPHTQNWNRGLTGLALGLCVCVRDENVLRYMAAHASLSRS